jgi:hypothetical protein
MTLARTDLQALAEVRAKDAQLLVLEQRYSSAYYLSGYAVEFALKACAAKQVAQHTIPDRDFFREFFTHEFDKLIGLAGLRNEFRLKKAASQEFAVNWAIVAEWRPESRYEVISATDSQLIVEAVVSENDGVLRWIKTYW